MTTRGPTAAPAAGFFPGALDAPARRRGAAVALTRAAGLWVGVAALGQLMFALYILGFYGRSAIAGDLAAWSKVLPKGYVSGDVVGNAAIASHLLLAVVIILGGALQLVPVIRRRAPGVHRWTGRAYLLAALLASIGGLYLVWVRGSVGGTGQHLGVTLNAVLIVVFAARAWRAARARAFGAHRRWALRLFLAGSGVWFFRIGLMLWLLIHRRPVGFDPTTFRGPFLVALSFAQTLLPLAVLELYFAAQERGGTRGRLTMAAGLVLLTIATGAGIVGATMGMWLPHL